MSQFGAGGGMAPQLPFMPFGGGGGPPSAPGSDYGGGAAAMSMMPTLGYQGTGSMYGMPMGMNMGMMGGGVGSVHGSQIGGYGGGPPPMNPFAGAGMQRPTSTFSFATSVNPFAGPSMSENPTDEELFQALRNYLSTQDLMSVTKK
jgi:chitin synthase